MDIFILKNTENRIIKNVLVATLVAILVATFCNNTIYGIKKRLSHNVLWFRRSGRGDAIRTRNLRFWRPLLYR